MTTLGPGGTVGILGGGQLARMLALEGRRMGLRIAVLDPDPDAPAAQVSDFHIQGSLDDFGAAAKLAASCDVLTVDTEHVPAEILERLEAERPVRPRGRVLRTIQDRLAQREFLAREGAPQVPHAAVRDVESLGVAVENVGLPAVLKTRRSGYDGKGQAKIRHAGEVAAAWDAIGQAPSILERWIDFALEISVVLSRDLDGRTRAFPVAENQHAHHVLRKTLAPARIDAALAADARRLAERLAAALDHVGVLAVEFFVTHGGELLVNEIAPRTHNSGHYTLGACATSQFEQHLRAICGMPLGDPALLRPAVMLNLLGDLWGDGAPDWSPVLSVPGARLHLYGKRDASPGRKMGHVLLLDDCLERASALSDSIESRLRTRAGRRSA